mgnify:CR=1 FL=1
MKIKKLPKKLILRNVEILDPLKEKVFKGNVLLVNGKIAEVGKFDQPADAKIIDCEGLILTHGFCDLHVHFREPGREDKETISSGAKAAIFGGFTEVCTMPNTNPSIDSAEHIYYICGKSSHLPIDIFPIGVGSNLIIRDGGIRAAVIRLGSGFNDISFEKNKIIAGASALDSRVASRAADNGFDLTFLRTIPGSIGGAIKMNAGCYGSYVADFFVLFSILFASLLVRFGTSWPKSFSTYCTGFLIAVLIHLIVYYFGELYEPSPRIGARSFLPRVTALTAFAILVDATLALITGFFLMPRGNLVAFGILFQIDLSFLKVTPSLDRISKADLLTPSFAILILNF